jgi:hypothetical protein
MNPVNGQNITYEDIGNNEYFRGYSFKELAEVFQNVFVKDTIVVYEKKYSDKIRQNSYAGFNLLDRYNATGNVDLFLGANNGGDICIRLVIEGNTIKAICKYFIDNDDSVINDYGNLQRVYGSYIYKNDHKNRKEFLTVWDTGESFILMGVYNQYIYYVALVDKSIIKI